MNSPANALSKAYDPSSVEERLYKWWESSGFFKPHQDRTKNPFTIIMPPPNVTGELHLGHAMTASIQDALIRYHRMIGDSALWIPGTDHAGIATQMVVERALANEGTSRHDLGREAFIERVWSWVSQYGDIIDNQHRRLGSSCDWSRKAFTLDSGPSKAVRTTFKRLFDKGYIYRGERLINWCVSCRTALSDLEVDHFEEDGNLYQIKYPFEDASGHITIATTRPETLLGDTAVAVNPKDQRYQSVIGKRVLLPILNRAIPIIADETVSIEFGTGALKITPGHDPNDFETGERHNLPIINILNADGTLNGSAGPYEGYDRLAVRSALIDQLNDAGLLISVEPHPHQVGHCQRSADIVEPIVSEQWFIQIGPLADRAVQAVRDHEITIIPERFERVYTNWMDNIRDWCISRQLWWGHRIPVWYCEDCAGKTVAIEDPAVCEHCGSFALNQDEDVLDTWFSSGLWAHSTLGWPDQNEDLDYFYPTSVMETGYDILFFWVARMIMLGMENMDDIPFRTVYLHGLVRDERGVKMSKTRGNVIDPLQSIATYGTDALRFALTSGTTPGNDTRLSPGKLQAARNFSNKIWNISRFVLGTIGTAANMDGWDGAHVPRNHPEDRWILTRLDQVTTRVNDLMGSLQIGEAERELYDFTWNEFADWYIELAKVRIINGDNEPPLVLAHVLESLLRLLHPFMPFITEELWQHLLGSLPVESRSETIMLAPYPASDGKTPSAEDASASQAIDLIVSVIRSIRNVRAELKIDSKMLLDASIYLSRSHDVLTQESEAIKRLAKLNSITVLTHPEQVPNAIRLVIGEATVSIQTSDSIDFDAELERIKQEITNLDAYVANLTGRLNNQQFLTKAPASVVQTEQARLEESRDRIARMKELFNSLNG